MARPQKEIDQTQFEKLCGLQCTKKEVAGWFDCSEDTIENWCKKTYDESFSAVFAKKRTGGLISLRRSQFRLAEKNATMAIWLGRNYLEQTDRDAVEDTTALDKLDEILKEMRDGADKVQPETE
jgi:hypothetical protein